MNNITRRQFIFGSLATVAAAALPTVAFAALATPEVKEDPAARCHRLANEMKGLDVAAASALAAGFLPILIADGLEVCCRTMKTWLKDYSLHIHPVKMDKINGSFTMFSGAYSKAVLDAAKNHVYGTPEPLFLTSYPKPV
jgi:hypothetical protein